MYNDHGNQPQRSALDMFVPVWRKNMCDCGSPSTEVACKLWHMLYVFIYVQANKWCNRELLCQLDIDVNSFETYITVCNWSPSNTHTLFAYTFHADTCYRHCTSMSTRRNPSSRCAANTFFSSVILDWSFQVWNTWAVNLVWRGEGAMSNILVALPDGFVFWPCKSQCVKLSGQIVVGISSLWSHMQKCNLCQSLLIKVEDGFIKISWSASLHIHAHIED